MINFYRILDQVGIDDHSAQYTQFNRRIDRSRQMTSHGYSLWGELSVDTAIGVIQSQSEHNKFYYSFIRADGSYGCFDNALEPCLGQPLYISNYRRRARRRRNQDLEFENDDIEFQDQILHRGNEYRARWEYAQPCKHVLSLLNGFCARTDSSIQNLLENWITVALKDSKRPIRDVSYASYIQGRFDPVKHQVLERTFFSPIIDMRNERFSRYKPSRTVKILDSEKTNPADQIFEIHLEVTEEEIHPLPLKNSICVSCLQREQDAEKLKSWVQCKHCLSQMCGSCFAILQEEPETMPCPSVFNGYQYHKLEVGAGIDTRENKNKNIIEKKPLQKDLLKNIIFKFGDSEQ